MLRLLALCVVLFACVLDFDTVYYFKRRNQLCDDYKVTNNCYCDAVEDRADASLSFGSYHCNNPFAREPTYLVVNAVMTVGCALILAIYLFIFTWIVAKGSSSML